MSKAIYIVSTEPNSGKSVITLGLMNMLVGKIRNIAYFKPVVNEPAETSRDIHIETILSQFGLNINYTDTFAFTYNEFLHYRSVGNSSYLIDGIIAKFKKLEESHDFVVVEGTGFNGDAASFELDSNIDIAKNLGIPLILITRGDHNSAEDTANGILSTYQALHKKEVQVLAMIANKINPADVDNLKAILNSRLPKEVLNAVIPFNKDLGNPTMKEIVQAVKGKLLFGHHLLSNQVDHFIVGAMQLRNCLTHLKENTLIVTPGDRADIIVAMLQANISKNYPKVAGMILSGGLEPEEPIIKLVEGLETVIPMVQVESGTFETVNTVGAVMSRIYADNKPKIELAIGTFEKFTDAESIIRRIVTSRSEGITPRMFQYQLVKRAKLHKKHIVLPEGSDDRVLIAASKLIKQEVVDLTILGKKEEIETALLRLNINLDMSLINIIDPLNSPLFPAYAESLYELRKTKNVNMEMARDMMSDGSYFATMMVFKGDADGMVSGAINT
ncbi:MAG: phosphate acetyltransferase, partial [Ferruginibacter sp.]